MQSHSAYKRGVLHAIQVMEQGKRDLEAQAAEEALERGDEIPYEQKMNALRHNLKQERLAREKATGRNPYTQNGRGDA